MSTRPTTAAEGAAQGQLAGYGSKAYRNYVLFALTFIYILNLVDQVFSQFFSTQKTQDIMRTALTIGDDLTLLYALTFEHVDVTPFRNQ